MTNPVSSAWLTRACSWKSSSTSKTILYPDGAARFIVLEGLSAVGKSTIAPLLAQSIGAVYLDTLVSALDTARQYLDAQRSSAARLHFWMAANYLASDVIRATLGVGRDVVIESYFFRTLATHAAMGIRHLPIVDWDMALVPHTVIELVIREDIRQCRLAGRAQAGHHSYWSDLEERDVATTRCVYDAFGLTRVDTAGLTPPQIVLAIQQLLAAKEASHAP